MDKTILPIQKPTAKLTNLLKLGFNASGMCLAIKERKKSIGKESLEFYQILFGLCISPLDHDFFHPGSQIPDPTTTKKRTGKNSLSYLLCGHKFH